MPRKKKETSASSSPRPKKQSTSPSPKKTTAVKKSKSSSRTKSSVKKEKTLKLITALPKVSKPVSRLKSKKASSAASAVPSVKYQFPRYGETQLVAFVRDPHCIFTYWEVTPEKIQEVKKELKEEFKHSFMVLRVFKIGKNGEHHFVYEITVAPGEMNRYVELDEPGGSYFLEIAQRTPEGRYWVYARSNPIGTPEASASFWSSSVDPEWQPAPALLNYFHEQGYASDVSFIPGGNSSAESQKRKRGFYSASPF